jgi:hypothetical protein
MSKSKLPRVFGYVINLDERGAFFADVRDLNDNSVYEVKSDDEGLIWQVEDGFMKHAKDISGLQEYLVSLQIIQPNERILQGSDFHRIQEKSNTPKNNSSSFEI